MYKPYEDFISRGNSPTEMLENIKKSVDKAFSGYIASVESYENPIDFETTKFTISIEEYGIHQNKLTISYLLQDKYDWPQAPKQD